jgi:hypothetical protein
MDREPSCFILYEISDFGGLKNAFLQIKLFFAKRAVLLVDMSSGKTLIDLVGQKMPEMVTLTLSIINYPRYQCNLG